MTVLKPEKRAAMITLLNQKVGQREISRNTGIDRKTICKYILIDGDPSGFLEIKGEPWWVAEAEPHRICRSSEGCV